MKFSECLNKLPAAQFLKEIYEVDKSLHHEGYRGGYSFIQNSMHTLNVSETNSIAGMHHIRFQRSIFQTYMKM